MRLEQDRVVWCARDKLSLAIALTFVALECELLVANQDRPIRSIAMSGMQIYSDGDRPYRKLSDDDREQEKRRQGKLLRYFNPRKKVHRSPRMRDFPKS